MFRRVNDVRNQLESTNYFSSLDGYLTSLQTINPSLEQSLLNKSKDRFLLGIPPSRASAEVKKKKNLNEILFLVKFRIIFQY
jgi:hypothetical protein